MLRSRCVLVAGTATILALIGIDRSLAGMIVPSAQNPGQSHSAGAQHGNQAPKQAKPGKQQKSKQQKSAKKGNGKGSKTGNTDSSTSGTVDPPNTDTGFGLSTVPDPPTDFGPPQIVPMPGAETFNNGLGYGSDLGDLPGSLTDQSQRTGGEPPVLFLEFNSPGPFSLGSLFNETGLAATELDQPQHMPEPTGFVLAAMGCGCCIAARPRRPRVEST